MSFNQVTNSTPMVNLNGIHDLSIVPLVAQPELSPMHLPLFYIQAPTGPVDEVVLLMPGDLTRIYGDDVIDFRKPYLNHATVLLMIVLAEGNSCFVKRIVRPTITTSTNPTTHVVTVTESNIPAIASITLMAEVDATTAIYQYARDDTGMIIEDLSGNPTFTTHVVTGGVTVKYTWTPTGNLTAQQLASHMTTGSKITYPLLTVNGAFIGALSNNYGLRLWTSGPYTSDPGDLDVINDQQALIYDAQIVYRALNTTPATLPDMLGENNIRFCFKPDAYNYKNNLDLTIQQLVTGWSDDGVQDGLSPTFGPIGSLDVHEKNLEDLLAVLMAAETAACTAATVTPPASIWLLDFLTGIDMNGINHYGFQINLTGDIISQGYTYYMQGGNDGDLTMATFEKQLMSEINNNWENPLYPLIDSAKFPFSCMYDSGFSVPVKKTIFKWTSYRKNVHVGVGTHVVGDNPLTISEEISCGIDLRTTALVYAESALWGTPACRIVMMMQSGYLLNSPYKQRVSTLYELVSKRARYIGAGIGIMKPGLGYDISPANQVTLLKKLSSNFLNVYAKNQVWATGLNFAQSFDRRTYFFPGLQTIYTIQNSVLAGELFMQICCDVEKQSEIVWRLLSGNSSMTEAQFIQASNRLLLELTNGKYDNRVIIVPNTYFTPADEARGYSWTLDVTVYGNVPKTVSTVNVITKRTSMYVPAATTHGA